MIFIENEQSKVELTEKLEILLDGIIQETLRQEGVEGPTQVSLLLVEDAAMQEINRENRGKDETTDVLSFPMLSYAPGKVFSDLFLGVRLGPEYYEGDQLVLGDIVLSMERALQQAEEFGHSVEREVTYLVVHSVLHLLGYDHMDETDKMRMRAAEERILESFGLQRQS